MKSSPKYFLMTMLSIALVVVVIAPVFAQDGGDDLPPEIKAEVMDVEAQVEALRELPPAEDIIRVLVEEDELRALVENQLLADYTPEEAHDDVLFYATFGFMPFTTDLLELNIRVLGEQIAGFYNTETNTMYVLSDSGDLDAFASIIYSHEYQHALQDANFGIDNLLGDDRFEQEPDFALARLSLIEGDAQLVTLFYAEWLATNRPLVALELLGQIGDISTSELDSAPQILQDELTFPYEAGMVFVQSIYNDNGLRLVDAIYERPPISTEQIMHPSLYLIYEEPQIVELRGLDDFLADLGGEWREIDNHPMGEFYIRQHLALYLTSGSASDAAAGWGGDQMLLYTNEQDATVVIWRLNWDTKNDSDEFNSAYESFASAWTGAVPDVMDGVVCWDNEAFAVCKSLIESDTLISIAPTQDLARSVIAFELSPDEEIQPTATEASDIEDDVTVEPTIEATEEPTEEN